MKIYTIISLVLIAAVEAFIGIKNGFNALIIVSLILALAAAVANIIGLIRSRKE